LSFYVLGGLSSSTLPSKALFFEILHSIRSLIQGIAGKQLDQAFIAG